MKKLLGVFVLMVVLLTSSMVVFANDFSTKEPNESRVVTVGYNVKDKEEIFGDMNDEEIDKIMKEKVKELLEDEEIGYESTKEEYPENLNSKLIISVSSNTNKNSKYNNTNKFNNLYVPNSYDEKLVRETFVYMVGFPIGGENYFGKYLTVADGIINRVGSNYMEGISTKYVSGANWPVKDLKPYKNTAHNYFYSFYELGSYHFGTGRFSINSSGEVIFHGVE
ncbi:hypothetical protein [Clostridiisalibacter paucivorans]|uniref:hypothetical protein n=1 Tax=Clostridiisalibacter paucivorans TaxID=408753 RepID=UPI00047A73C1|nr:hypothetical protein [Clostridiisalibacter paucivorans]